MSLPPATGPVLWILGAGGHGRVVADAARASGRWRRIEFFDDAPAIGEKVGATPVAGDGERFFRPAADGAAAPQRHVAVGDNAQREALLARCEEQGCDLAVIVHPAAVVSAEATLAPGCFVAAGAVVAPGAAIGAGGIVNHQASVDHDCRLGRAVHVGPGAHLGGGVVVGDRTWIGLGAAVRHAICIGADALVGAGAVVVAAVADNSQVVGNPARSLMRRSHA